MYSTNQITEPRNARAEALDQSLGDFGWGALLVVTGTAWLLPRGLMPDGTWLISVGLILLGLNAARYSLSRQWDGCSLTLGVLAFLAGAGALLHFSLPVLAITLIVVGLLALLIPTYEQQPDPSTPADRHCCQQ